MIEDQDGWITEETIIRHPYDVDAFEVIDSFLKETKNQDYAENRIKEIEEAICLGEEMMVKRLSENSSKIIDSQKRRHFILPSIYNEYNDYLALKLLIVDPYKIPALLSYQSALFLGNHYAAKNNFIGLIEFQVYNKVKSFDFKDNDLRREKIMEWVEKNRYFDYEDNSETRIKEDFLVSDAKFSQVLYENLKIIIPDSFQEDLYYLLSENRVPKEPIPVQANKSQIVEFFKRIKYNDKSHLENKKLAGVLCRAFCSLNKNMDKDELKESSVYDILRRTKDEPSQGNLLFENMVPYVLPGTRKDDVPPSND